MSKLVITEKLSVAHTIAAVLGAEARMTEIAELKTQIVNCSKTCDVYAACRKAGHSKSFWPSTSGRSFCTSTIYRTPKDFLICYLVFRAVTFCFENVKA